MRFSMLTTLCGLSQRMRRGGGGGHVPLSGTCPYRCCGEVAPGSHGRGVEACVA